MVFSKHEFLVGTNDVGIRFNEPFPSYVHEWKAGCCWTHKAMTLTMWLWLRTLPAMIFSTPKNNGRHPNIALRVLSDGNVTLFLKGQNAT
jgi:hypothetical protein